MLRITTTQNEKSTTLKLDGKLLAAWTDEVRSAYAAVAQTHLVYLDLSQVSFVDLAGISLLKELSQRGIKIAARSNYVAELLNGMEL